MKRVYGKNAKPALNPQFFDSSPELRRSPRLRKVLEERSNNIGQLEDNAIALSPCATKTKVTSAEVKSDENDEPTKRRLRAKKAAPKKQTIQEDTTDGLARTLAELEISPGPKSKPTRERAASINRSTVSTDHASSISHSISQPLLPRHEVALDAATTLHISPLVACKGVSKTVESFSHWLETRTPLLSFTKIGEGSYGQVFRATSISASSPAASTASIRAAPTVIIKLMALAPVPSPRHGRCLPTADPALTTIPSAATEVRLLSLMQRVPGFVEFRGACVLQGRMPDHFCELWARYADSGRTVESRDPRGKDVYKEDQLWLVLEMSDAGANLEEGGYRPPEESVGAQAMATGKRMAKTRGRTRVNSERGRGAARRKKRYLSMDRTWDVFWQTAQAVARAEVYCRFEHRDLHLGNICVRDTQAPRSPTEEEARLLLVVQEANDSPYPVCINSTGMLVTIIDYTLSRADVSATSTVSKQIRMEDEDNQDSENVLAFDLQADEALFAGEGDLQYDVYRWMDEILGDRGCKVYDPRTNLLWLYHLLEKLLLVTKPLPKAKARKGKAMSGQVATLGERMKSILEDVRYLLDPGYIEDWVANSAGELMQHAFAQDWINVSFD